MVRLQPVGVELHAEPGGAESELVEQRPEVAGRVHSRRVLPDADVLDVRGVAGLAEIGEPGEQGRVPRPRSPPGTGTG